MPELPRSLAHWGEGLADFGLESALALAPMLRGLTDLIGPFPDPQFAHTGEPDGYTGITRRSRNYDRLLIHEWLLAEEAPDEFLRRSVNGEHLFHQLDRRDHTATRNALVWFDAGPLQLGAPRIAHMALLLVLYHRARAAGVDFYWGILQQPEEIFSGVGPEDVRSMLKLRSERAITSKSMQTWRDSLGRLDDEDDLWLVGPVQLQQLAQSTADRNFSLLTIDEETGAPSLEVRAEPRGAAIRTLRLPLPKESERVALIRNPYHRSARKNISRSNLTAARPDQSGLIFDAKGRRIFARLEDESILCIDCHHRPATLQTLPPVGRTIAVGTWGKHIVRVVREDRTLRVIAYRDGHPVHESTLFKAVAAPGPLQPLYCWPHMSGLFFFDEAGVGHGFSYYLSHVVGRSCKYPEILTAAPTKEGLMYVVRDDSDRVFCRLRPGGVVGKRDYQHEATMSLAKQLEDGDDIIRLYAGAQDVVLAAGPLDDLSLQAILSHGSDRVYATRTLDNNIVPENLVGYSSSGEAVFLDSDRRALKVQATGEDHGVRELAQETEDIESAVVGPRDRVAYQTASGVVRVLAISNGKEIARYAPGDL
ncbi:MAG: hypothetical protein NXI24_24660 [bacterium]|nr:hypothetical protein [bacterium]